MLNRFRYIAVNHKGEHFVDEVNATGPKEVALRLKAGKLRLIALKVVKVNVVPGKQSNFEQLKERVALLFERYQFLQSLRAPLGRLDDQTLLFFTQQLAAVLDAGLTITAGLHSIFISETNRRLKRVILGIIEFLESGCSVYQAFSKYPAVFSTTYLGLINVGERAGILDDILHRLSDYMRRLVTFRKKVISDLTYPAIILFFSLITIAFMMIYFVPSFIGVFRELDTTLPLITLSLIQIVKYITDPVFWLIVCSALGAIYVIVKKSLSTLSGKFTFDSLTLKIPLVGDIIRNNTFYLIFLNLACMLEAGVLLKESLEILKSMTGNMVFKILIGDMLEGLQQGRALSDILKGYWFLPKFVPAMMQVGEATGELAYTMRKSAEILEENAINKVEIVLKFIEPATIIMLALFMGYIMLAVFLPLYQVMNSLAS